MFPLRVFGILLACACALAACSDDNNPADKGEQNPAALKLAELSSATMRLELWSEKALQVGYNIILIRVYTLDNNDLVTDAHVSVMPMMTMPNMQHSAPVENPHNTIADDGIYRSAVVFMMPGDDMNSWQLSVSVHNHADDTEEQFDVPVNVAVSSNTAVLTAPDNSTLLLTLLQSQEWSVGLNDIEFTVHRRESMMSFPAAEDLSISMVPDMPSMGHGSHNNVDPVHTEHGHYSGKVNFSMTGEWRLSMTLKRGDDVLASNEFMVQVQ